MHVTGNRAIFGGRAFRPASSLFGLLAGLLLVGLAAAPVQADGPTRGEIVVRADHVEPEATFTITGYLLDESAPVRFELVNGESRVELGAATTTVAGTLEVDVALPAGFPTGYATLLVHGLGTTWSTTVLVGDRAEGPGAQAIAEGLDPLVALLVVAGVGLLGLAGFRLVRH